MPHIEVPIAIGPRTETFVVARVDAPAAYDHGSAIEIYDGSYRDTYSNRTVIDRIILVPAKDQEWQRLRNKSGLHSFVTDPGELIIDADDVAQALWKRLYGREAA